MEKEIMIFLYNQSHYMPAIQTIHIALHTMEYDTF